MIECEACTRGPARMGAGASYDFPASHGGGPHRVLVYVPEGAAPAGGWPLLLASDGNATFDLALGMMRTQALDRTGSDVAEGIVVAVGYQTDRLYDQIGRCFDLTPAPGRTYPGPDGRPIRTGGAACFLAFLEGTLLPWLGGVAPIDPHRRTLFGHSFGGLFTLFALYARPSLFAAYVAACPSLYWEDAAIKPFEDAFFAAPGGAEGVTVALSAGEWEGDDLAPHLRERADAADLRSRLAQIAKVARADALRARFRTLDPTILRASLEVYPRETHMSALVVGLNRAVQVAFRTS